MDDSENTGLNGKVVFTIHGTGDAEPGSGTKKWWEPDSKFSKRVSNAASSAPVRIIPFKWSGANSQAQREQAANKLAKSLNTHTGDIDFIAHSHGGHVCLRALSLLNENHLKRVRVFLVGSPYIIQKFSASMRLNLLVGLISALFIPIFIWAIIAFGHYKQPIFGLFHVVFLTILSFSLSLFAIKMKSTLKFLTVISLGYFVCSYLYNFYTFFDGTLPYLSSGVFFLASLSFVHIGKTLERGTYDREIRRTLERQNIKVFDIHHPKDEVFELFEQSEKYSLQLLAAPAVGEYIRSILIYFHFFVYAIVSIIILNGIIKNNVAGLLILDSAVVIHTAFLYSGVILSFIITYGAVEWFAQFIRSYQADKIASLANSSLRSTLRNSMLGSDTLSATEFEPSMRYQPRSNIPIPESVAREMAEKARAEAEVLMKKLLDYNVLRPAGVIGTFEQIEQAFSWKSLLHCSYFDTPFVVDAICDNISGPSTSH